MKKLLAVVGATALLAFAAPAAYAGSGTEGYGGSNVVAGLEQGGGGDTGAPVQVGRPRRTRAQAFRSPVPTSACSRRLAVFCLAWASACAG